MRSLADPHTATADLVPAGGRPRPDRAPAAAHAASEATTPLGALLSRAAGLDLEDRGWSQLTAEAAAVTGRLVTTGHLPAHLAVSLSDPPVVAVRTIAAAWRSAGTPAS